MIERFEPEIIHEVEFDEAVMELNLLGRYVKYTDIEHLLTPSDKCRHKHTIHKADINTHPYGDSYSFDKCQDCGKKINLKAIHI